jgi:hypothetical protein
MAIVVAVSSLIALSGAMGMLRIHAQNKMVGVLLIGSIIFLDAVAAVLTVLLGSKRRGRGGKPSSLSTSATLSLVAVTVLIQRASPVVRHPFFLAIGGFCFVFFTYLWIRQGRDPFGGSRRIEEPQAQQ